jgi:uncharacterized protein (DUF1330 family)
VVVPLKVKFGGKFSIGKVEVLEGQPGGRSMVVFEFPSMEVIHAFWNSPEYVPVKKLRQDAATVNIWAVLRIPEGLGSLIGLYCREVGSAGLERCDQQNKR